MWVLILCNVVGLYRWYRYDINMISFWYTKFFEISSVPSLICELMFTLANSTDSVHFSPFHPPGFWFHSIPSLDKNLFSDYLYHFLGGGSFCNSILKNIPPCFKFFYNSSKWDAIAKKFIFHSKSSYYCNNNYYLWILYAKYNM